MYIHLDKVSKKPLSKQLYLFIKQNILSGRFVGNHRLPSSRSLSKDLGISRNVVLNAYSQLIAEGYIYSRDRSGIYVAEGVEISILQPSADAKISDRIGLQFEQNKQLIDFRTGVPDLSLFPKNKWGKLYREVCIDTKSDNLDYYEPCGSYELRSELCGYLSRVRGVEALPENVIITSGAAQSFSLLVQYFSKKNKNIVAEDPMSFGITKILEFFDMNVHPVPVDALGMATDFLPKINPSLIFTTPSHHFPTGAVLPMNRRIALIEYARKTSAFIIEDDYDSEFRYEGYPIQSMQSLAKEHIIYVGTFSKTLCPALRIGYMVLPEKIAPNIQSIKYIDDLHSPVLEQLTLAKFIREGMLDRHIAVSKKCYAKKCSFLTETLKKAFGPRIEIFGNTAGIHLMVRFKGILFTDEFVEKARINGLNVDLASNHALSNPYYNDCFLLGFGNLEISEIRNGIRLIKETISIFEKK